MKKIFTILILTLSVFQTYAQSPERLVREYARLMNDYIRNGNIDSRDKILNEIFSDGARISDRVAMVTLSADGSSQNKVEASKYIERLRVQNKNNGGSMTFVIQKIEVNNDGDEVRVFAKIKISASDTKYRNFYYPHVLYDKFVIRDNRITWIMSDDDYMIKDRKSFTVTSCTIRNVDNNDEEYRLDAVHSRYLKPTLKYNCTSDGQYDIYVKMYDANGTLKTGNNSPRGYTYISPVKLSSGEANSIALLGWGNDSPGNWKKGDYRFEFYYEGELIYTHKFNLPEEQAVSPIKITLCRVFNTNSDNITPLTFDAAHSQYLKPVIKYDCDSSGSFDIYVKLYANGRLSTGNSSPRGYSYMCSVDLSRWGVYWLSSWGYNSPGNWNAGDYRLEFYHNGLLLYTYSFKLPEKQDSVRRADGHDYVDLGLPSGTLWATCNIGTTKPWEDGSHFAWGEVETREKNSYGDWKSYKYSKGSKYGHPKKLIKYCRKDSDNKQGDNLTELQPMDDAAYVKWGRNWCMPTEKQFRELKDSCAWVWINSDGKKGYYYIGTNGNAVFFPWSNTHSPNGGYWSRDLYGVFDQSKAFFLRIGSYTDHTERCNGLSVRAVRRKN